MEQFQCKMCGQPLRDMQNGFYKCSACLSEFSKESTDNADSKQINEAYELIRKGKFGDAEDICSTVIKSNKHSHEAYWVRALAKNGVVFVKDIGDRMVPTCQNIIENEFLSDADVIKAIELAPESIAENYKAQGQRIEEIRREWFDIASKEEPYDVFICFKDSDKENGINRTRDSEYAQDLYQNLSAKGLKVFFSRVSLMGKVSEHYEPYIYNALRTAKVMIVYAEKAEYFNATWLKNEWGRFITRMQRENMPSESLVVAYRGVDPYRIPSALLGGRQGLNLESPSAFGILVDRVIDTVSRSKKVVTLERKEIKGGQMAKKASSITQTEIKKRAIGANTSVSLELSLGNKLKMVKTYMAQRMWENAKQDLDIVLAEAPQNGDALICSLLLKTEKTSLEELSRTKHFTDTELLQRILDSADVETAQKILDLFYGLDGLPRNEYIAVLSAILPYEYENRAAQIKRAFELALQSTDMEMFDLLLQAIGAEEVDTYIELNTKMLVKLCQQRKYWDAWKYIAKVLSVDEGNVGVRRIECDIAFVTDNVNFIEKFEELLKYSTSPNEVVTHFIDKILSDKKITVKETEILKKILAYYKGSFKSIQSKLLTIADILIQDEQFDLAEYFDNLILDDDSKCTKAWLHLCFIGTKSRNFKEMSKSSIPVNLCRGYDEYCSLADDEGINKIIGALKEQQSRKPTRQKEEVKTKPISKVKEKPIPKVKEKPASKIEEKTVSNIEEKPTTRIKKEKIKKGLHPYQKRNLKLLWIWLIGSAAIVLFGTIIGEIFDCAVDGRCDLGEIIGAVLLAIIAYPIFLSLFGVLYQGVTPLITFLAILFNILRTRRTGLVFKILSIISVVLSGIWSILVVSPMCKPPKEGESYVLIICSVIIIALEIYSFVITLCINRKHPVEAPAEIEEQN